MHHTCKLLYEQADDGLCLACAFERAHYMRTEYDPEYAALEAEYKERLRETMQIRDRENEANEARLIRDMLRSK
jgi:hypothetical protein